MPAGQLTVEVSPDGHRIVLGGELDMATVGLVSAALDAAIAREANVVLDLAQLEFVDSTGIAAIVRANTALRARGCSLTLLVAPGGTVARVLDLTGVRGMLDLDEVAR